MSLATQESSANFVIQSRSYLSLLALVLTLSLGLSMAGCGGGGDDASNDDGGAAGSPEFANQVEALFKETSALVEQAKLAEAEKYAAADLDSAIRGLNKAKEYMDVGDYKKGKRQISSSGKHNCIL